MLKIKRSKVRVTMFRHRVGELMKQRGVSYSQLSRRADIGMRTCKLLYENPHYEMSTGTLYKCSKFFGVPITDLLVEDEAYNSVA